MYNKMASKEDNITSTSEFVDQKIQIFQSDYDRNHCYKCDREDPYQFFSNDADAMVRFSSAWFSGENVEQDTQKNKTKPTPPPLDDITLEVLEDFLQKTWKNFRNENKKATDNQCGVTNIEFCKKIPLLPMYRQNEIKSKQIETTRGAKKQFKDAMWCRVESKSENIQKIRIGKCLSQPLTPLINCGGQNSNLAKRPNGSFKKFPYQTKVATSKFGRQRKVLDFSNIETMYDSS